MTTPTDAELDVLVSQADTWQSWLDDLPLNAVFNDAVGSAQEFIRAQADAIIALRAELAKIQDPNAVHIAMLTGRIAKPSAAQIVHIYAGELTRADLIPAMLEAARRESLEEAAKVEHLRDHNGHWGDFVWSALNEAEKAMRKFPQPNYVISKIAEEAGEVVKAAIHCAEGRESIENVRGEMRQLIAMLFRLWMEGDQVHGLPPVSSALAASPPTPTTLSTKETK